MVFSYHTPTVSSKKEIQYDFGEIKIVREKPDQAQSNKYDGFRYDFLVKKYADEYGVSSILMKKIMLCENDTLNPNRQSEIRYTQSQINRHPNWGNVGDFEKSYGLCMIHVPACNKWEGKCITEAQAKDPDFAIMYMAHEIAGGRASKWTCYSLVKNTI